MKDPLDLINDCSSGLCAVPDETVFDSILSTVRTVLLTGSFLLSSGCSSVQNSDTAILKEKAKEVREAMTDLNACTEQKGHDDCKEYHDRYDRKIDEYLKTSIQTAEIKDSQVQEIEKTLKSEEKYSELGKTVYWGAWTAFGLAVLFVLGMFLWKNRLWIARAAGIPVPPWMT